MTPITTRIIIVLQVCLFGAISTGCGSDGKRDSRGPGGASGDGGASQGPPTGNAGVAGMGGLTGTGATQGGGGPNGGGANGGQPNQPPPGAARVQFVLKEVH